MSKGPFRKLFYDHRISIAGWLIAFVSLTALYVAFFPVMKSSGISAALDSYPPALRDALGLADMTSPAGFIQATVFSLVMPVVMIIFAVLAGTWVIGDDEATGTLDLLLSQPISRNRLVLARTAGTLLLVVVYSFSVFASVLVVGSFVDLHPPLMKLLSACVMLALLTATFLMITVFITCLTGQRTVARAVSGFIAVMAYLMQNFASQVPDFDSAKYVSLFYYYSGHHPLYNGFNFSDFSLLFALVILLIFASLIAFGKRDIRSV